MRKIVAIAILCCLVLPGLLAAEPKSTTKIGSPSVQETIASWIHGILQLIAHPTPLPPDSSTTDGRCTIDPNGGCTP